MDEELRRELLARRDSDQRIRTLVPLPPGQYTVNAGQPQLYGTQFSVTDGDLEPRPIENPHRLDERREQAGLESFADYKGRMRAQS